MLVAAIPVVRDGYHKRTVQLLNETYLDFNYIQVLQDIFQPHQKPESKVDLTENNLQCV